MDVSEESLLARIAALQKDMKTKKSFVASCRELAELCEKGDALPASASSALADVGKAAFTVLQARFSNPKFWQAGLELFLALEFIPQAPAEATKWREAALLEVDEEARENAQAQAKQRRLQEDKMHNKGNFSDAVTPITAFEAAQAEGILLLNGDDDRRPGMSRDARDELKLVTVLEEELCVVCQETLVAGSKAKTMPCGHKFHDDCLVSWVTKSNSCPTCRFDEMPSEKQHFDDVQRQVQQSRPEGSGLYA